MPVTGSIFQPARVLVRYRLLESFATTRYVLRTWRLPGGVVDRVMTGDGCP